MTWKPITGVVPQYSTSSNELASGYYLKFYVSGTTTPYSIATDSSGATRLAKIKLSDKGYPITNPLDNTTTFVPHVDADYRIVLYENETDADNNTTANAIFNVDGLRQGLTNLADMADVSTKGTTLQIQDDYDRSPLFVDGTDFTAGAGPHVITVPSGWTPSDATTRFYKLETTGVVVELTPTATSATTFTLNDTLTSVDVVFIGDDYFRNQMDGDPADIRSRLGLGTVATLDTGTAPGEVPTNGDLGTAATADVQTSSTDTTADRLMAVGAFGLGASAASSTANVVNDGDYNLVVETGFHHMAGAATNSPFAEGIGTSATGTLIVNNNQSAGNDNYISQLYIDINSAVMAFRYKQAGTWQPWQEILHTGNAPFANEYLSSAQTIVSAGLITLAHGLGAVPKLIQLELECTSAESGYSIGDRLLAVINNSTTGSNRHNSVYFDSTNVYMRFSADTSQFTIANKNTGASIAVTNANWKLYVRAFA